MNLKQLSVLYFKNSLNLLKNINTYCTIFNMFGEMITYTVSLKNFGMKFENTKKKKETKKSNNSNYVHFSSNAIFMTFY